MSDIEHELGAELIRRHREGRLHNGAGGKMVREAARIVEEQEAAEVVRKVVRTMQYLTRGDAVRDLPRRFLDMAAEVKRTEWFQEGSGI